MHYLALRWSMVFDVNDPAPFAPLQAEGQPPMRWIDLLEMRSGLTFVEDYEDASVSHCLEMLFSGEEHPGVADMGMYPRLSAVNSGRESIELCLRHNQYFVPHAWRHSRRRRCGIGRGREAQERNRTICERTPVCPIGTSSPIMKFDATGTFVGRALSMRQLAIRDIR